MAINWTNTTTPYQLLAGANYNTGGFFWLGMLFMVFFVMIMLFIRRGINIAMTTSAFICLVIGIFFTYMNLMAWSYTLIFAGVTIMNMIYIMWNRKLEY